jgi:inorganic triphosphatase YgiF
LKQQRPQELELKVELSSEALERLKCLDELPGWSVGQPRSSELRSIHFDTSDLRLRAADIFLQVRSTGGKWTQTVKCGTKLTNGVSAPVEIEVGVPSPTPSIELIEDKKLRRKVANLVHDADLAAVFETDVVRTTRKLSNKKGRLELALDEGIIRAGPHERPVLEAELELKSGARSELIDAAEALFADHPFNCFQVSKAERGYELMLGRTESSPAPLASAVPDYRWDATCAEVLAQFMAATAQQIVLNRRVVLETDDPEGAHQLRVGLRRLRTALRVFGPLLGNAAESLETHCKALARVVGQLRDADVLLQDICAPLAGAAHAEQGMHALHDVLSAHRTQKRNEVRKVLNGREWNALQIQLALWPKALDRNRLLNGRVSDWAPQALDRAWKKVVKKGKNIAVLDTKQRHELRKALKNIRYSVEYFGQHYAAREVKQFTKKLKALQDEFGYLNDAATAAQVVLIAGARAKNNAACREAAGYVLGWHTARAETRWERAQTEWKKLRQEAKFWR